MRTAVIGVGNMGSTYAAMIRDGMIDGMDLSAITRPAKGKEELFRASIEHGLPVYDRASDLFDAVEKGKTELDAVVISTPHYSHQEIAERAFRDGLDVLCDKPSGVFSRQTRIMEAAADKSGAVYGMIFNQRTLPLCRKLHIG